MKLIGDCREILPRFADESFNCCVTSPPYFGQRDYNHADQMGLEKTPDDFIAGMVQVFREIRRVLRDDGTLWLNIGDSYNNRTRVRTSSHKPLDGGDRISWKDTAAAGGVRMTITREGWKEKDLFGIPWMLAQALRVDGWYLRQEIIWHKPVAKLDVAKDRPLTRHEALFLLSKSKRYYFDGESMPQWSKSSVWTIPATGSRVHGAAFPSKLVEPCILAGSPISGVIIDPFCGSGTTISTANQYGRRAVGIDINN